MPLAFGPDSANPLVAALLAELGTAPELAVDEGDEMLAYLATLFEGDRERALFEYFRSGASIAAALAQVLQWRFGDLQRIARLLDFASGYGRVTRFLVRQIPPERVFVADVYEGALRFQEERLGVSGIVSAVRPEELACDERFDAILVTSLFTHLPEERFGAWLRRLLALLAPGGMLVLSAHSPELLRPEETMPESGFLFRATSESGSLDTSDYGSTWVSEEFVRAALARAAGPDASLHRIARGLCNFQDLYLALPEPDVDFSSLRFHGEPQLAFEGTWISGDALRLQGWAAMRCQGGEVAAVEAVLDGRLLGSTPVDQPREDVAMALGSGRHLRCGWCLECRLPAGASRSTSLLLLRAADARGTRHPLWAGTLEAALRASWHGEARRLDRELRHEKALMEIERAQTRYDMEILRIRIAAMRASRFWKLRNAWFRLKKRLGLVEDVE
jgi:SAM-dependent methyltransferase